jgi:hypothetical protein
MEQATSGITGFNKHGALNMVFSLITNKIFQLFFKSLVRFS